MKALRRLRKFILHLLTSKPEVFRLLEWQYSFTSFDIIIALRQSIFVQIIENPAVFDVLSMHNFIAKKKMFRIYRSYHLQDSRCPTVTDYNIAENTVSVNLSYCLHSIKIINMVIFRVLELQSEPYQSSAQEHIFLLNKLWNVMKPNIVRTGGMITADWGLLGFQGNDPATDFRGMGVLSLLQLIYFGEKNFTRSQYILAGSHHSRRFFPYAATSIAMTAFVLELLMNRRLHQRLFLKLESSRPQILLAFYNSNTSESVEGRENVLSRDPSAFIELINNHKVDIPCRDILMSEVHEIYCEIFYGFFELWELRDPPNVMSFQEIFREFKESFKLKYTAI